MASSLVGPAGWGRRRVVLPGSMIRPDPTDKPRADLSVADLAVTNLLDACLWMQ